MEKARIYLSPTIGSDHLPDNNLFYGYYKTPLSLTLASQGATVKTLQSALSAFGLGIPAAETQAELYGVGTTQAVTQFQVGMNLPVTGNVDAITQAMITNLAGLINANKSYIAGVLVMDYGIPANQVEMRLFIPSVMEGRRRSWQIRRRTPMGYIPWPTPHRLPGQTSR